MKMYATPQPKPFVLASPYQLAHCVLSRILTVYSKLQIGSKAAEHGNS
jgi:hypothetical protein